MSRKSKYFDHSNNYLESVITKIVGFSTSRMGYTEDGSYYYYWYNIKEKQHLIDNINNIKSELSKIEKCDVHVCHAQCEDNEVVLILIKQ
jgi:hypothetical protein